MIRRETSPELVNRLSNMAGVREHICYHDQPVDWTPAFPAAHTGVIVLTDGEQACAVFGMTGERVWQVHTLFGPQCRGQAALDAGRDMIEYMRPYADVIWGATPMTNPKARWFNRQLGARVVGRDQYEAEGDVELFELRLPSDAASGIGIPVESRMTA